MRTSMKNKELARMFDRIADALEIKGETGFRVVAYHNAARALENLNEDVAELAASGKLKDVPGIGTGTADKIEEFLTKGRMKRYDEVMAGVPAGLLELLEVQGLGGKTIHLAWTELGVKDRADLSRVIADGSLAKLKGMGEKKVENIRRGLDLHEKARARISIYEAMTIVDQLLPHLRKSPKVAQVEAAGSLRRMRETIGDIDILACGQDGSAIIRHFIAYSGVERVLGAGGTKSSVLITGPSGPRQVDLRVVDRSAFGAALQYFTGSKSHNIKLRGMAKDRGLKISEYGVFKGAKRIAGEDEESVYRSLGLPLIPPEMREDRGEVELALKGKLLRPIGYGDMRGDLHVHSVHSDGRQTLAELADLGKKMGYDYIAVCDHSRSASYANGMSIEALRKEMKAIDALNAKLKGFTLLKGVEVDIRADGSLDFPDSILKELDFVVASIHSGFKKNVTERMIKALLNPFVDIIGHPTGRLISGREGYEVNIDRVIEAAAQKGKALELNAYFDRLDLNEANLKKAKDKGVRICLGTDTHAADGLAMMRFGVGIARRAWLEKGDVLNGLTAAALNKWKKDRRA